MSKRRSSKFEYRFKPIHLLIFSILFFLGTLIFIQIGNLSIKSNQPDVDKKQNSLNIKAERIEISGVEVNDFFQNDLTQISESYVSIVRNKKYHVFFIPDMELFIIAIGSWPFEELQKAAEEDFLYALGISKDQACRLNVSVTTAEYANPDKAGEVYDLSFCSNNK